MGIRTLITAATLALGLSIGATSMAQADTPFGHSGASVEHSGAAIAHASAAGVKTAASVAAVPLIVIGGAGELVGQAGDALIEVASGPLPIGDTVVHAHTPDPAAALRGQ